MSNQASLYIDPVSGNVGIGTTVTRAALDIAGNAYFSGGISAGNLGLFRNRIINGDMSIDQRNVGSNTIGTGVGGLVDSYFTYKTHPSSFYTVDRFAIESHNGCSVFSQNIGSLISKRVALNSSDVMTLGGGFANAVELGQVPTDGLMIYLPLDSNIADASGNAVIATTTGTMRYVDSCIIGSNALYLSNEPNVVNTETRASNRISFPYYQSYFGTTTISHWFCCTKLPTTTGNQGTIWSLGLDTNTTNINVTMNYSSASAATLQLYNVNSVTTSTTINANIWYHVAAIIIPGSTCTLYVNGNQIGNAATNTPTTNYTGSVYISLGDDLYTSSTRPYAGFIDDFRVYNRLLSESEIIALANNVGIPTIPATSLASGLTTRLTFDNTTVDAQGSITLSSGTATYAPICKMGVASLDLTGNTAGASTGTAMVYGLGSSLPLPITFSYWFNVNTATSYQVPFSIVGANNAWIIHQEINATNTGFRTFLNGSASEYSPAYFSYTVGTWIMMTVTFVANSYLNIYFNGVLIRTMAIGSSTALSGNSATTPYSLRIGSQLSNAYYFKGLVDDFRIYNRALSSREVAGLYVSSQHATFSIFRQSIEGNNISDLGWGTTYAQPVTANMWIKNRTTTGQQFSIAVNNTGLIAWMNFEDGSYADKLGLLINEKLIGTGAGTGITTSVYKIGSAAMDFTANTPNTTPTTYLDYNCISLPVLPLTISLWIYITAANATYIYTPISLIGSDKTTVIWWLQSTNNAGFSVRGYYSGTLYDSAAGPSWSINQWYLYTVVIANGSVKLYTNGELSTTLSIGSATTLRNGNFTPAYLRLGARENVYPCKCYIDDVRIYKYALSPKQIYQLYKNNENSITQSTYLIPRSLVYNTPVIPANTWQKVSLTIPGDTTGQWMTDNDFGLTLSLCLGATGLYNTATLGTWLDAPEYMGSNVQLFGNSETAFLASIANSIYVTGWQLEKGTMVTPFEFRPTAIELRLCERYYQRYVNTSSGTLLYTGRLYAPGAGYAVLIYITFDEVMRIAPTFTRIGDWSLTNISAQPSASGFGGTTVNGIQLTAPAAAAGDAYYYAPFNVGFEVTAEL
jgi:hypothetical protein